MVIVCPFLYEHVYAKIEAEGFFEEGEKGTDLVRKFLCQLMKWKKAHLEAIQKYTQLRGKEVDQKPNN